VAPKVSWHCASLRDYVRNDARLCRAIRRDTPLWFYILREADVCTGGHRLGPVGGRIVTEVLVGLIDADATSFRRTNEKWQPQETRSELLAS